MNNPCSNYKNNKEIEGCKKIAKIYENLCDYCSKLKNNPCKNYENNLNYNYFTKIANKNGLCYNCNHK